MAENEKSGTQLEWNPRECPDCGVTVSALYCGMCGRRLRSRIRPLREFIADGLSHVWDFGRDTVRSIWALATRPGRLTCDFLQGLSGWRSHPGRLFVNVGVASLLATRLIPSEVPLFGLGPALFGESLTLTAFGFAIYSLIGATLAHWAVLRHRRPMVLESLVFVLHVATFSFLLYPIGGLIQVLLGANAVADLVAVAVPVVLLAGHWIAALSRFSSGTRDQVARDALLIYGAFVLLQLPLILAGLF